MKGILRGFSKDLYRQNSDSKKKNPEIMNRIWSEIYEPDTFWQLVLFYAGIAYRKL
jgi:hypothetical protein